MSFGIKELQTQPVTSTSLETFLRSVSGDPLEIYRIRYVLYTLISDPKSTLTPETLAQVAINVGSIPLLSFSVRRIPDLNSYLRDPNVAWLVYLYRQWPDPKTLATASAILVLKGARPDFPAYTSDPNQKYVLKLKTDNKKSTLKNPTVNDIIHLDRPDSSADIPQRILSARSDLSTIFDQEDLPLLAIYLDDPTLASIDPSNISQVDLLYSLHAQEILKTLSPKAPEILDLGVDTLEPVGYSQALLSNGPSYFLLNKIIINLLGTLDQPILMNGYLELLLISIDSGYELDRYQAQALEVSLPKSMYQRILNSLSVPSWKKICSSNAPLDSRVRNLARGLEIDYTADKSFICAQLNSASQVDPNRLVTRSENTEKKRFLLETSGKQPGKFTDLTPEALKTTVCSNSDFTFDSSEAVYFEDTSGAWCLAPDKFKTILFNKTNPYTGAPLPNSILRQISDRLTTAKEYNFPESPLTFQAAVNKLIGQPITSSDSVDNSVSDSEISQFTALAVQNGVLDPKAYIQSLPDSEKWFSEAIRYLGGSSGLTPEANYATLARLVNLNPANAPKFFSKFFTNKVLF